MGSGAGLTTTSGAEATLDVTSICIRVIPSMAEMEDALGGGCTKGHGVKTDVCVGMTDLPPTPSCPPYDTQGRPQSQWGWAPACPGVTHRIPEAWDDKPPSTDVSSPLRSALRVRCGAQPL